MLSVCIKPSCVCVCASVLCGHPELLSVTIPHVPHYHDKPVDIPFPHSHTHINMPHMRRAAHRHAHRKAWWDMDNVETWPCLNPHRSDYLFAMMGDTADWHFPPYRPSSQSTEIVWWHCWLSRHSVYGVCVRVYCHSVMGSLVQRNTVSECMWVYVDVCVYCMCVQGHVTVRIKGICVTLNQGFAWLKPGHSVPEIIISSQVLPSSDLKKELLLTQKQPKNDQLL